MVPTPSTGHKAGAIPTELFDTNTVFFGTHLVKKGLISLEQLKLAMAYQQHRNFKFGDEAVACGILTAEQLKNALQLQRQKDIKVGEACIELQFLTEGQVSDVLAAQRTAHVYLGQALVSTSALTVEQLGDQLRAFQESDNAVLTLDAATDPEHMVQSAIEVTAKILPRLGGISAKVSDIRTGKLPQDPGMSARVGFKGSNVGFVGLRFPSDMATKAASYMLGMPATDDLVLDVLGEIVNTICGNLTNVLASSSREYTLSPPVLGDFPSLSGQQHVVLTEFLSAEGPCYLVVSTSK